MLRGEGVSFPGGFWTWLLNIRMPACIADFLSIFRSSNPVKSFAQMTNISHRKDFWRLKTKQDFLSQHTKSETIFYTLSMAVFSTNKIFGTN
jgi:hypothetical protein